MLSLCGMIDACPPCDSRAFLFHVKFLKPVTWPSKFFSRIMATYSIPKIWRKAKVIAVEKPGKDPSLAANYCDGVTAVRFC